MLSADYSDFALRLNQLNWYAGLQTTRIVRQEKIMKRFVGIRVRWSGFSYLEEIPSERKAIESDRVVFFCGNQILEFRGRRDHKYS
jgi:hypothetical protein